MSGTLHQSSATSSASPAGNAHQVDNNETTVVTELDGSGLDNKCSALEQKKSKESDTKGGKGKGEGAGEGQEKKLPPVSIQDLFAYATRVEIYFLFISFISAALHGAILPCFTIVFGSVINSFGEDLLNPDNKQLVSKIGNTAKWFLVLGALAFITSAIQVYFALRLAQRLANRLRMLYFRSLMRQDHTYFDSVQGGRLTGRIGSDVNLVESGIGDKLASIVQLLSTFIVGMIIAFLYSWKLTLVMLSACPLLMFSGALFAKQVASGTVSTQNAYASAAAIAAESLSLVRVVTAFNRQEDEARRYEKELHSAYVSSVRKSGFTGFAIGLVYFVIFSLFAICFAFGAYEVRRGNMEGGDVVLTFFSVFLATMSLGQAAPAFSALAAARGAAPGLYEVIRRHSDVDPLNDEDGRIPDTFRGDIQFENVIFDYPTLKIDGSGDAEQQQSRHVLNEFELNVRHGCSQALVGFSGCGKSTTVRLIERFYDVNVGRILIDGVDIREYNVRWLRSQIGYVGQMPTLFMLSIRDNIAMGAPMQVVVNDKLGGKKLLKRRDLSDDEIIHAAKMANAHDFIMKLPEKYNTILGERGALLSGGQKQRICIARALVRNPKILLLDESTSALDAQSERHVQDALERAAEGRTSIIIAHRLSTVKNCDMISLIDKGQVVEEGTHAELMIFNGAYRSLVENQNVASQKPTNEAPVNQQSDTTAANITSTYSATKDDTTIGAEPVKNDSASGMPPVDKGVFIRALKLNVKEIPFILFGMIGATLMGVSFPILAFVFSSVIVDIFQDDNAAAVRKWALLFVGLGAAAFLGGILQYTMLGISGGRLTKKLRSLAFRALLRQEIGFFDDRENSVGQLTSRLATEASLVQGITGDTLGSISLVVSTMIAGFLISYLSCWEVALTLTALFPLMAVSEAGRVKVISGFDTDAGARFAKAGAVASEAVDNFDTITSLGAQDVFIRLYEMELEGPAKIGRQRAFLGGISFGFAEFTTQLLWAVAFWVGAVFVNKGRCNFLDLLKGISGLIFAGAAIGQASQFSPDLLKSRVAATNVFRLIDRKTKIDPSDTSGERKDANQVSGHVGMRDIEFEYPTRPDVHVLRGLSLEAKPGQTIALVGESGCGKSTIISLLERFYDPREGEVWMEDVNARDYNVNNLRSHLGIVTQEPDLFNQSIRDNIIYGMNEGTVVTDEVIESAARLANAHDFITTMPQGYDTIVGHRGSRLSGGQRQRIAIARSLVRCPRILLLDEATSALDAVAEAVVQRALNDAAQGRTTITIAHRLSTVKDADVIGVVKNGRIVESGKHDNLMRRNAAYAQLVRNQMSEVQS